MVWDRGRYEPQGAAAAEQMARGKIDVVLQGHKLRGGFTLIRTGTSAVDPGDGGRWLLVKQRDEYADPSWDIERPEFDRSVLTGRTLKEIEEGAPANGSGFDGAG